MRAIPIALALALLGCDEPEILERSARACANDLDDDGDGAADCDDPDCAPSGACEVTLATCQNGLDDDGDGRADCEDADCVSHPDDPCRRVEAACDPVTAEGCVRGLTCVATFESTSELSYACRLPGELELHERCDPDDDRCGPGLACPFGFCEPACRDDASCETGSRCLVLGEVGYCSTPCTPWTAVEACDGQTCIALHAFAFTYEEGGADFACIPDTTAAPFLGEAEEGEACERRAAPGTPLARRCALGLACVPDVDGTHACRRGCSATLGSPGFGCEDRPCHRCAPSYPLDDRPGRPSSGWCECDLGCGACE